MTHRRQYRPQVFEVEVGIETSPRVAARTVLASWGAVVRTVWGAVKAVKQGCGQGCARVVGTKNRGTEHRLQAMQACLGHHVRAKKTKAIGVIWHLPCNPCTTPLTDPVCKESTACKCWKIGRARILAQNRPSLHPPPRHPRQAVGAALGLLDPAALPPHGQGVRGWTVRALDLTAADPTPVPRPRVGEIAF